MVQKFCGVEEKWEFRVFLVEEPNQHPKLSVDIPKGHAVRVRENQKQPNLNKD